MNWNRSLFYSLSFAVGLGAGVLAGKYVTAWLTGVDGDVQSSKTKSDSDLNLAQLMRAVHYSTEKHQFQKRKNSLQTPYISHPVRVANQLVDVGIKDQNIIIAALLHDTVEDTDASLEEIESLFGPKVAKIVDEVSDDKSLPKHVRKQLQIEHAPHVSYEAKLVKLSDKLDNLKDLLTLTPVGWSTERVGEYFDWSSKVIEGLRGTNPNLEQMLDQVLLDKHLAIKAVS